MDIGANALGSSLLDGCCLEAERAERVGIGLEGLRNSLNDSLRPHLTGLIGEVHSTSRLLRDLADQSQIHISRVPVVIDYLNVILPCLCRSLRDITTFYEDRSQPRDRRWKKMYHEMSSELLGTTLPARFVMYNLFLVSLQHLLTKSPNFDMNGLESLRTRILQLREARGIPPPSPIQRSLIRRNGAPNFWAQETNSHWAESIFTQPLPSRTELEKPGRTLSEAYGPLQRLGQLNISPDVKILIKRSFDNDRLSVTFFLETSDEAPFLLIRTMQFGSSWVSLRGAHELSIRRGTSNTLTLTRWSKSEEHSKPWAILSFITCEELVLFYCTFVCLKARSVLTIDRHPDEFKLRKESKVFQAKIIDDGYEHILNVFQDPHSGRKRLHASVWDGELRFCPVWTAFLPDAPPKEWLLKKSRYRVQIRDIQPYVFCQNYRAHKQRKGKYGAFELNFAKDAGATHFKDLFDPRPPPTIVSTESDDSGDPGPSGQQ
ncbi:uncharacterized protein BCR38DRAFT_173137 [Pseudomassariella vexata]|uniref:Uncharacterized protein n=1 Tax=Pseudomassariella vexata TaxID=1141098 RepID=A0A1Y2E3N1_9PEZI|nr:uncharacterized protein BCR38DRAFT_173137 [Pseudomassariella vexata]ORY66119.1 hypothetical protein BCR38DRAFT_173137 [Pseudomassariella vexata]